MALDMTRNRPKRTARNSNDTQFPNNHSNTSRNSHKHDSDDLSLSLETASREDLINQNQNQFHQSQAVSSPYNIHNSNANENVRIANTRIDSLTRLKKSPLKQLGTFFLIVIGSFLLIVRFSDFISIKMGVVLVIMLIMGISVFMLVRAKRQQQRFNYIRSTPFPANIWNSEALRELPLNTADKMLIRDGLRDFFLIHALKPNRPLAMPSKYVDKLWHAFILDTHNYHNYCMQAFGKVLHHVPDYAFHDNNRNIRMYTYQAACRLQSINPAFPRNKVPRLFAIDTYIDGVLRSATLDSVGAISLAGVMNELSRSYLLWFMLVTSRSPASGDDTYIEDAEIDEDGDNSCGSSDGGDSDCGSGCGGD